MSDTKALADSRLPDLPDAGGATAKQRELTDAIMFFLRGIERNRLLLLEVVCAGASVFRRHFINAYRVINADAEFADAVFGYMVLLAGPNPEAQKAQLELLVKHQQQAAWDRRLSTALAQAKESQALLEAIEREERRLAKKSVRIFLN